jgi:hypothetical protein
MSTPEGGGGGIFLSRGVSLRLSDIRLIFGPDGEMTGPPIPVEVSLNMGGPAPGGDCIPQAQITGGTLGQQEHQEAGRFEVLAAHLETVLHMTGVRHHGPLRQASERAHAAYQRWGLC